MSLALHGHHVLLLATLVFVTAVLTPNWYTSSDSSININALQICFNSSVNHQCHWTYSLLTGNAPNAQINLTYPILIASFALGCVAISFIGLLLGSWHLKRYAPDNESLWLLILTMLMTFASVLLSCAAWAIMLTTNVQQQEIFRTREIRVVEFGFSFWTSIASSIMYSYALIIYLAAVCKG